MEKEIEEDYCSYKTSKLLKDKGFNESIETLIQPDGTRWFLDENSVKIDKHLTIRNSETNPYSDAVICPTLQMAAKWLREVHKIYIDIGANFAYVNEDGEINFDRPNYTWDIICLENGETLAYSKISTIYLSYERALEEAIVCSLKNLI